MKKRLLSGILALTMCFSMTPSIAWGSGMTEFSDGGASGETEEKEVFTDEPEVEKEKEQPVAAAGVPEVEDGFSDGILDAAQDTSVTTKHTVTIDTSSSYKIGTDTMYDVINNHDGTLTVGEDPEIKGSQNELRHVYRCVYESDGSGRFFDMFQNPENPENGSWSTTCNKPIPSTPNRKIQIDNIYTCFLVTTTNAIVTEDNIKYYGVANKQIVTNPIKVNYDLLGGSGGPTTDWIWNVDGLWKNAHDTEPTKAGYKFDGWYTEPNGNGIKIDTVSQAVDNARVGSNGYKEVTLYAKWEHKHVWQYSESGDTLKAYCSNTDSQCEYHGTSFDNAKATVSLKLNGFDSDKCAKYGSIYDVTYDNNNFTSETGATIGTIQYVGCDGTKYLESPVLPISPGKYKAKVNITLLEDQNSREISTDFEIKPLPAKLDWSSSDLTYNGEDQTVTASVKNALPGDGFTLEYETNEIYTNTGKNAQTYKAKVTDLGNANYSLSQEESIHPWVINPKAVTVKPDDLHKHIGGEEPQLTYTTDGIVEGETLSGITLQRVSGEDARKYIITATETAGANPNYTVTRETGTFTIEDHNWPKDGKILSPATSWSEGMKERTCTAPGCGQKRYDAIPKQDGKPTDDPFADKIDKYIQIFGSEITAAALDNEKITLFEVFPQSAKDKISYQLQKAKVWLEINQCHNLAPEWENLINIEIGKTVGKNADRILFDINLYSQLENEFKTHITDPGVDMNIRFKIPDKMINNQPYTIRDYKILRLHKDSATNQATVDILDPVFNSSTNELTFKSDKFSIYVLTYKDTYYSPSYPVTGIKVSPDTLTLTKKGETAQLTAEVTPSYADNKRVIWQSSDEKVATVDENGKVTAVENGTATITATSVSGSYTATVSVTVKIPVEIQKLTIEAEKETLTKIGESTELKVKIEPENADLQKLIWKSDNEKVATTDENGKVTAVGNGTAEITVTTEDGKITASIMITVKVPDEPTINKTTGFRRLRARSVKQTKTSVTLQWNIIEDADGYFVYGNRCNTGTKSYKYRKLATITGGDISTWTQKDLKKGTYYKYVVKAYRLVNGKKVVTDTSISVHAVTGGGQYGNAKAVSVTQIGNKKNVSKITLKMGKTAQIKAKEVKKDNKIERHRKLCYESSNTKVATVTPDGLIRATGKGTCTIWVYAQNGVYKALKITVK